VALGDRVYVGDMQESIHFVKMNLNSNDNQLVVYADDSIPRHLSTFCMLDYDTICGSDKFGNVFVLRLPGDVSDDIDNPTGNKMLWDTGLLNGAPSKLEQVCQFHVGELVTSMQKTNLVPEGQEAIVYSTVMGSIGALIPFQSQEDIDFYTHLEMHMRSEYQTLIGRDVVNFRSYYLPIKDTVDGDFCEQYTRLPRDKQQKIAEELDRTPAEVIKKLEDIRSRLM
jgi:splicing factor 3B subunit 3